jgi:hypothetical protein
MKRGMSCGNSQATVEYRARTASGHDWHFQVDLDRPPARTSRALPVWTELSANRCDGCPLGPDSTHCPAAVDLVQVAEAVRDVASIERVDVAVTMHGREVRRQTDSQELVRSLVGLVLSTSACPILRELKPLAHMHAPFATFEETLFRSVALYLVRAWFDQHDGKNGDFALEGMRALYGRLAVLNRALAARLRSVAVRDAGLNGLVQLFTVGLLVSDEIEHRLEALRPLVGR